MAKKLPGFLRAEFREFIRAWHKEYLSRDCDYFDHLTTGQGKPKKLRRGTDEWRKAIEEMGAEEFDDGPLAWWHHVIGKHTATFWWTCICEARSLFFERLNIDKGLTGRELTELIELVDGTVNELLDATIPKLQPN